MTLENNPTKNKTQLIKEFNSVDFKSLETNQRIYLLKVLYSYYEGIVRTYHGSGLFFLTSGIDDLNDYFKVLRKRMVELVGIDDTFTNLQKTDAYQGFIEPLTSLYSAPEFIDGIWEDCIAPMLVGFREEIADKDLFENSSEVHKIQTSVVNFLEATSQQIEALKDFLNQKTKSFYEEDLPREKEKFNQSEDYYISKQGDDFRYKGKLLKLSPKADYYKVFSALYALLPNGGEIGYKDLIMEVKSRIPKTKSRSEKEMIKLIQGCLTDKSNGFVRYAKIPNTEDNSKPLIEVIKGFGMHFNNKTG